jgi:phosphatidylglycerophosphatase A
MTPVGLGRLFRGINNDGVRLMLRAFDRGKWLVATCGGLGYFPGIPGTISALWGVLVYVVLALWVPEPLQTVGLGACLLAVCWVTIALARWAEGYFGEEDSGKFVTDEVAGFLLTVLLFRTPNVLATAVWAFVLTRVIDMIKVPPARRLEQLPAGWGVLADDLLSSVYAAAILHLLRWQLPGWFLQP